MRNKMRYLFIVWIISASSFGQSLQDYIQIAEENHPQIQAILLANDIANEKVNQSRSLANTELSLGYFISEPETRTGPQQSRVAVGQMIPWFGTLSARVTYAKSLAENAFIELSIAKRKLSLSVAQSYYDLYRLNKSLDLVLQILDWLDVRRIQLLGSVSAGESALNELLELDIFENTLKQRKGSLTFGIKAAQQKFNNLVGQALDDPIELPKDLLHPEVILPETPDFTKHPELLLYDGLFESVEDLERLNQKERLPGIAFGVDYLSVAPRTDLTVIDNGKDILMPRVNLSIPVFGKKYESKTKQNKIELSRLKAEQAYRLNLIEDRYFETVAKLNEAQLTIELLDDSLERLSQTEELLLSGYIAGDIDFQKLIKLKENELALQLQQVAAVVAYYNQLSVINYLINP
jgi:cobalt-zinc-cadmium efflux system outer membrane protein